MTNLKSYIDFAYSVTEMDEVKTKGFPIPKEIIFKLPENEHESLQKEIFREKEIDQSNFKHTNTFEIEVYNIILKFEIL